MERIMDMPDKGRFLDILQGVTAAIRDVTGKLAEGRTAEGLSHIAVLADLLEELINMDMGPAGAVYDVGELNDMLSGLVEAMGSGDVVLVSDILEYRVLDFVKDVGTRAGLSN